MEGLSGKYFVFTKLDWWVLYFILPPYLMTLDYIILGESYFHLPLFFWATLVSFLHGIWTWAAHIIVVNILKNIISSYAQTGRRILIQMLVFIIMTTAAELILFWILSILRFNDSPLSWYTFGRLFIAAFILDIVSISFYEGIFAFNKWRASALEAEQLKKNYLQSQLEGLKSQVNPHFLFNSLNSLSALIYSDQEKAGEFLDEMSKVYRYLLRSNEHELIPLKAEVQFAHSFFHMLKTRYNEGIELNLNIKNRHLNYLIPPLTLQLLIENAVKHNVISRSRPLSITIFTDENDTLIIRNNIQRKSTRVLSNGIGLQNIITKYKLLAHSNINIKSDDNYFIVQLPLFNPIES